MLVAKVHRLPAYRMWQSSMTFDTCRMRGDGVASTSVNIATRKDAYRRFRYAAWLAVASLVGLSGVCYWQREIWQKAIYSTFLRIAVEIPMPRIREM